MNKFHAKKARCCHGHLHDSQKEANHCDILHIRLKHGEISNLEIQKRFDLLPAQKVGKWQELPARYIADFYYLTADGQEIAEDVKGLKKGAAYQNFVLKRKLMLYMHGIHVREI